MTKFRIGDVVACQCYDGKRWGVVTSLRGKGQWVYVELDHNPNISQSFSERRVRKLTREERAVRIAKKAMRIRANA